MATNLDRTSLAALAVAVANSTPGTTAAKVNAACQALVDAMRPGFLIVSTNSGNFFAEKWDTPGGQPMPGRPVLDDVLAFATAMEQLIISRKGTAQDPDGLTLAQLVAACRSEAVALPALLDAQNGSAALASIVKMAAIAVVVQSRIV